MRTDESWRGEWWEIQHRYPGHEQEHYQRRWVNTDLTQFGREAALLVFEARKTGTYEDYHFPSRAAAIDLLTEFIKVATIHATTTFRVARVRADIHVSGDIEMAPAPICGKYGYYQRTGERHQDLYCQQPPGHSGKHGPQGTA